MSRKQTNESTKPEYWYIEGKAYDLTNFEHPGGPVALSMGKGRDATELVHSYHPFSELRYRAILKKYLVNDCVSSAQGDVNQIKQNDCGSSPFVWTQEGSPFFNELSERVKTQLDGRHYATPLRWLQIFLLACMTIVILPSFLAGSWWALFAFPIAYWMFGVNTFHDASHFSLSKDWRVNYFFMYLSPGFSSPFTWFHQHVIGHHVYTNMQEDPDLHHGRSFWRYSPDRKYRSFFKYQLYYFLLIWTQITMFLAFVLDSTFMLRGHYESIRMMTATKQRKIIHVLGRITTFSLFYLWPFVTSMSWMEAIIFSIVPNAIFSACFGISSQLNHINEENMHGDVVGK
jgi:delta11-fatty-acid desaturase